MKNIAILGLGVVGKGTADLLEANKALIEKRIGEPVTQVTGVGNREECGFLSWHVAQDRAHKPCQRAQFFFPELEKATDMMLTHMLAW